MTIRKLEFKGKLLEEKGLLSAGDWVFGGYYADYCYGGCPEGKHYIVTWNSAYGGFTDLLQVDPDTVSQLTGIKIGDKALFEGDILNDPIMNINYVVEWDDAGAMFLFCPIDKSDMGIDKYELEDESPDLIIIGDKWSNPEFLPPETP